jgi:hypothetical protein
VQGNRGVELLWGRQPGSDKEKCPCGLRQLCLSLCQRLLRQCGGLLCLGLLQPWRVNPLLELVLGFVGCGFLYFLGTGA